MSTATVYPEALQAPVSHMVPVSHIDLGDGRQPVTEALAEMAGALTAHYSLIFRRIVRDFRTR